MARYGNEVGVFVETRMESVPLQPQAPDLPPAFIGPVFNIVDDDDDASTEVLDGDILESLGELVLSYPSREDANNPIDTDNVEVELLNASGYRKEIDSGHLTITDDEVTFDLTSAEDDLKEISYDWGGDEDELDGIEGAEILVKYRESREDLVGRVILAQGPTDHMQKLGGPNKDNPLGLMGSIAASVAPGTGCYYVPTKDYITEVDGADEGEEISLALERLQPKRVYSITALSNNPQVQQSITSHVNMMSEPEEKKFRLAWTAIGMPELGEEIELEDGEEVSDLSPNEIKNRQADYLASYASSVGNKRTIILYQPFTTSIQGEEVELPSYYLAGMFNAFKASLDPEQGLTRYNVPGVVKELKYGDDYFNNKQLKTISEGGVFACEQEVVDAPIYSRGQWTTNMLNNKTKQVSIQYCRDYMSFAYMDTLEPMLGVNNVTDGTIDNIRRTIGTLHSTEMDEGPLISGELIDIYQDEDNSSRVNAKIENVYPSPLDQIVIVIEY